MFSRAYQRSEEFKARQGCFDFAVVARAVLDIAVSVRASLKGYLGKLFGKKAPEMKKPRQLVLFGTVEGLFNNVAAFEYA